MPISAKEQALTEYVAITGKIMELTELRDQLKKKILGYNLNGQPRKETKHRNAPIMRNPDPSRSMKAYWAKMTPQERHDEVMRRRAHGQGRKTKG